MNIIAKLTLKTMSKNKKRTAVTIIGIVISVAMIMAVSTIAYSFTNYMGEGAMRKSGQFHVVFEKLPYENKDKVLKGDNIGESFIGGVIGDYDEKDIYVNGKSVYKDSQNENTIKTVYRLIGLDKEGFEKIYFGDKETMEGRFPENEGEIMVSAWYATDLKVEKQGDIITLDGKDYTICGIYDEMDFETRKIDIDSQTTCAMFTFANTEAFSSGDYINIYSKLMDLGIGDIYDNLEDIKADSGAEDYYDNSDVLYYYGIADNSIGNTLSIIKYTLIVIIMIGAISLIANGFSISLSERSRYLGMIASIGATKKQKRYSVFFEGFVVGVISIPIGILSGYAGTAIVFKLIEGKINSIIGSGANEIKAVIQPWIIVSVIIFSVITIFLSAYIPARRASKISPIDAIRQTRDIKLMTRQVKTSKITRRLFGIEGELALKNLKRNKKKYAITIFSMVISIVLFLTVYTFSYYLTQSSEMVYETGAPDMSGVIYENDDETYERIIDEVSKNPAFGKVSFMTDIKDSAAYSFKMKGEDAVRFTTKGFKNYYEELFGEIYNGDELFDNVDVRVVKFNELYLNDYLKENGLSYSDFIADDRNIIVINKKNTRVYKNDDVKLYEFNVLDTKQGDNLTLTINSSEDTDKKAGEKKEIGLRIFGLSDKEPLGLSPNSSNIDIIVTENMFNNILNTAVSSFVNEDEPENDSEPLQSGKYNNEYVTTWFSINDGEPENHVSEMDKIIEKYSSATYYGTSLYERNKENDDMIFIIDIFTYGFIVLMTLVCAANIFNTISTGITLRRREFATLRSIGMTKKSFNRMIMYESSFYGMKALLYGLPISILIILFMWYNFTNAFDGINIIPWTGVIISAVAVFAVTGSSMLYASSKIKNANIIDGLKDENI